MQCSARPEITTHDDICIMHQAALYKKLIYACILIGSYL